MAKANGFPLARAMETFAARKAAATGLKNTLLRPQDR